MIDDGLKDLPIKLLQKQISWFMNEGALKTYNFNIETPHLYYISRFSSPYLNGEEGTKEDDFLSKSFMIKKWEFTSPKYEFSTYKESNITTIKNAEKASELKLTFLVDEEATIERYHQNWFNSWYNRLNDCFVNGIKGKFRNIELVKFGFKNPTSASFLTPTPIEENIEIQYVIKATGLVPKNNILPKGSFDPVTNLTNIDMAYNIQSLTISYVKIYEDGSTVFNPNIRTFNF